MVPVIQSVSIVSQLGPPLPTTPLPSPTAIFQDAINTSKRVRVAHIIPAAHRDLVSSLQVLRLVSEKVSEAGPRSSLSSVYRKEGPDEADQKEAGLPGLLYRLST